jgi:hypothetical protein
MIRKTILAIAAVAALGAVATTDASAKGWKGGGFHKGGIHFGFGHGYRHHRHWGPRVTFYAPAYNDCYKVVTRRGRVKLVCSY